MTNRSASGARDGAAVAADPEWAYPHDRSQVEVTETMVHGLLAEQFPQLACLPLRPLLPWGTDNAMYRLGEHLIARLPRSGWAKETVAKEAQWLPGLASQLPVAVPEVVQVGAPSQAYPWTWAIYRWIVGHRPSSLEMTKPALADQLADFLNALASTDPGAGPSPGPHNGFRGGPPAARDRWVRPAIFSDRHGIDPDLLHSYWNHALSLPAPSASPRWVHGDLTPNNLLVSDHGDLAAVLDWGCLAVGDVACDLMIAWTLNTDQRAALRVQVAADDQTWQRGRAAAFWQWIGGVSRDEPNNEARRVINAVLADYIANT